MTDISFQNQVYSLVSQQKNTWTLARDNYEKLSSVLTKTFYFDGFSVFVQYNPARIISSAAKVDADSISLRPCFLCSKNRPNIQTHLEFNDFEILINPYPIFPTHLTIPLKNHVKQSFIPYVDDFLKIASLLPDFVIFYNGPNCGASAPDHMHFQAGNASFLPLIKDFFHLKEKNARLIHNLEKAKIFSLENYLRKVICIESPCFEHAKNAVLHVYNQLVSHELHEPMINVVAHFRNNNWYVFIFPRASFRPWQYSAPSSEQLLVSPAIVEMAGVFITPIKDHFEKINKNDIISIFSQTSI